MLVAVERALVEQRLAVPRVAGVEVALDLVVGDVAVDERLVALQDHLPLLALADDLRTVVLRSALTPSVLRRLVVDHAGGVVPTVRVVEANPHTHVARVTSLAALHLRELLGLVARPAIVDLGISRSDEQGGADHRQCDNGEGDALESVHGAFLPNCELFKSECLEPTNYSTSSNKCQYVYS